MKVYLFCTDIAGSGHYRIIQPFMCLREKMDMRLVATVPQKYFEDGDLFVFHIGGTEQVLNLIRYCRKNGKATVIDVDDWWFGIPYTHPDWIHLRLYPRKFMEKCWEEATAITVPTKELKKKMLQYNRNVFVIPNFLDLNLWESEKTDVKSRIAQQVPKHNLLEAVIVGWAGGCSHYDDLMMFKDVVDGLMKSYDYVWLVLAGYDPGIFNDISRKIFVSPLPFKFLPAALDVIDIGVAPLIDNEFNECKSPVKVLEYGMKEIPVVTSDVGPYRELKRRGAPILTAKNSVEDWLAALSLYISSEFTRVQDGSKLKQWVQKRYILQKNLYVYRRIWKKILELA